MAKRTKEQEISRRERQARSFANNQGYMDYRPEKDMDECCIYSVFSLREQYKFGWKRAEREYNEKMDKPICPCCGERMDTLLSGDFCPNRESCGYHTHNDE